MCAPLAIAAGSLALGVGSALVQNHAQTKAHNDSAAANARTLALTTQSANRDADLQNSTLDLRMSQETQASNYEIAANSRSAAQSNLAADRSARMADAQSRLAAGASGVEGASLDALTGDIARQDAAAHFGTNQQAAQAAAVIRQNLQMTGQQVGLQRQQIEAQRQDRINGATNLPTAPAANPWATGLQIGTDVLGFMSSLNSRKPAVGTN